MKTIFARHVRVQTCREGGSGRNTTVASCRGRSCRRPERLKNVHCQIIGQCGRSRSAYRGKGAEHEVLERHSTGSTPTEMASTRLRCFECLASTGVNASGTMFPTFTFSGQTRVKPSSREPCGDFPAASGQEWRLIDSNVATATGPGRAGDNSQMDTSAKTGEGFTFSISAKKERFPASSILAGFPRTREDQVRPAVTGVLFKTSITPSVEGCLR